MLFKNSSYFIVLLGLILSAGACSAPPLTTTVEVTGGTIEGVEEDGIFSYKGIPFAAPPAGDLRWKAPPRRRSPGRVLKRQMLSGPPACKPPVQWGTPHQSAKTAWT
jgi:carboxylesterase type B